MLQPTVPLQSLPPQPANRYPAAGTAAKATAVPVARFTSQFTTVVPQLMPLGVDVTEPNPVTVTDRPGLLTPPPLPPLTSNVAFTAAATAKVTMQSLVPEQPAPDQPTNCEPPAAAAVSVTFVLGAKLSLQSEPQSMPNGLEVTAPEPLPLTFTTKFSVDAGGFPSAPPLEPPQAANNPASHQAV